MTRLLPTLLVVLLTAAACTAAQGDGAVSDDGDRPGAGATAEWRLVVADGATASGPGVDVSTAIFNRAAGALLVNGSLFIDADGGVLLCEAIAESFPPQCGGDRLLVEGLEVDGLPDLQEADGVRWAESVQILGTIAAAR